MVRLLYSAITSLDGYVADEEGDFDWSAPDEELHTYVNDQERPVGTYLYGRRMYEVMAFWETAQNLADAPPHIRDYTAIWQAADKIVYSSTLDAVYTARTRLEPRFEPDAIRRLKETATADISVGGPTLAAQALQAGLVDECSFFVTPVAVGGGTPALPAHTRLGFDLVDQRTFTNGVVHLRYRPRP